MGAAILVDSFPSFRRQRGEEEEQARQTTVMKALAKQQAGQQQSHILKIFWGRSLFRTDEHSFTDFTLSELEHFSYPHTWIE